MFKIWRKIRLTMCIWGWHKKHYDVGGYRCEWCGKFVEGYKVKEGK